jgi:hypothetical protein
MRNLIIVIIVIITFLGVRAIKDLYDTTIMLERKLDIIIQGLDTPILLENMN